MSDDPINLRLKIFGKYIDTENIEMLLFPRQNIIVVLYKDFFYFAILSTVVIVYPTWERVCRSYINNHILYKKIKL